MTFEERQQVGNAWVDVAGLVGAKITRSQISMLINAVQHLPADRVVAFLSQWTSTPNARRLPLPIDVLSALGDRRDPRQEALEAASRVIGAVSMFGWVRGYEARAYIGELGWTAVQRIGGWTYLCENLGVGLQVTTVQAQLRDLCEATFRRAEAGLAELPPSVPSPQIEAGEAKTVLEMIEQRKQTDTEGGNDGI